MQQTGRCLVGASSIYSPLNKHIAQTDYCHAESANHYSGPTNALSLAPRSSHLGFHLPKPRRAHQLTSSVVRLKSAVVSHVL